MRRAFGTIDGRSASEGWRFIAENEVLRQLPRRTTHNSSHSRSGPGTHPTDRRRVHQSGSMGLESMAPGDPSEVDSTVVSTGFSFWTATNK